MGRRFRVKRLLRWGEGLYFNEIRDFAATHTRENGVAKDLRPSALEFTLLFLLLNPISGTHVW